MTGSALVIPLLSHPKCLLITLAVDRRLLKHLRKREMLAHVKSKQPRISLETKSTPAQRPWVVCVGNRDQKTFRHLIFITFSFPFTTCCSTGCICNAIFPPKWFISVSTRVAQSALFWCTFWSCISSCLWHLFQYLICCGMLRLCPPSAYFVLGRVDKKRLFYYYLNNYLVKLFFQTPCVQIHALCFVPQPSVFLKVSADILRDLSGSEQFTHLATIPNPLGKTEQFWCFPESRLMLTPIPSMEQAVKILGSDCL